MTREVEMHICMGSSCFSRGNKEVVTFIRDYLKKNHLEDKVIFKGARCMGNCSKGPNLRIGDMIEEDVTVSGIEVILDRELAKLKYTRKG
jgi:NADH:ubiquinone oxidoreductase subunit E